MGAGCPANNMAISAVNCTNGTVKMRELVRNILTTECVHILPDVVKLHDISIKADARFGFHVVTSPRFICTLKMTRQGEGPSGVKVFVKNRPNVDEECKNMRLLWGAHYAESQKYHIPEPLYLNKENALLFMRYWPGETLLPILYKSVTRGRRQRAALLEDYIQAAAGWLVDFQDIYSSVEDKPIPSELLDFDAQLTTATYLDSTARQRIIHKMRGLEKSLPALKDTYVHDQYLFRNILYRNGEVCVVDFPHFRTGWPLYDFFTFYTGIERLKQYPFISDAKCDWMKDLFAEAYFSQKGIGFDAQALENLWAFFLIGYVAKRYKYKKIAGVRGTLNNIFVEQMFAKLPEWSKK
jgi:hypothetical protein